jgi:hypothetical protein
MKEPVDHILRPSLPWRPGAAAITECGYDASKVKTLSRADFLRRYKELGMQRSAMLTCMTCSDTARRWGAWEDDPRLALQREIEWERGGYYYRERKDRGQRLKDELLVIADLIENHRAEFDAAVSEIERRRAWNEKKAALAERPKPKPTPTIGGL